MTRTNRLLLFILCIVCALALVMAFSSCDYVPSHETSGTLGPRWRFDSTRVAADSAWQDSVDRADSTLHANYRKYDFATTYIVQRMLGLWGPD